MSALVSFPGSWGGAVSVGLIGSAVGLFVVTNVDDIVILALFYSRGGAAWRVTVGQFIGFAATVAISVAGAYGARLLPDSALPYLGLLPLALGLRAVWELRHGEDEGPGRAGAGVLAVTIVTLANGGDNIGVYVPVFSQASPAGVTAYVVVFLLLTGVWCVAGKALAERPLVARGLARWGHVLLPVVLIVIGVVILLSAL